MQKARMLGNYAEQSAERKGLSISTLGELLNCNEMQVRAFFKGRSFLSFDQLSTLSDALGEPIASLLAGNQEEYDATVVHCMNSFKDPKNREMILDIIDDYVDVLDAVSQQ